MGPVLSCVFFFFVVLFFVSFPLLYYWVSPSSSSVGPSSLVSASCSYRCSGTRWASLGLCLRGRPACPSSCVDPLSGSRPGCVAPPISRRAFFLFSSFAWSTFLANWQKWGYTSFVTYSHFSSGQRRSSSPNAFQNSCLSSLKIFSRQFFS